MKLSNLFNNFVRVAQGLRKGSARPAREWLKSMTILALLLIISIGNAWGAVTALTIPKSWAASGGSSAYTEALGCTKSGLGSDYSASGTKLKFNNTGDYMIIQLASSPAYVSYAILGNSFSGGTFKVQESSNGSTYTDVATYTTSPSGTKTNNLKAATRYIKFIYTTKSSGNIGLGTIVIKARTSITLNKNGGSANGSAVIAYNATAKESLSAPTYAGNEVEGYYAEEGCSTKVLNADGSFAASSVSGWITSSKWSKDAATATLYAKWESSCANTVTIDKGASTNCSFSLDISGAQASCDGVVTTISITPNTGYGTPVVSESGASSTPTKEGSGNSQTLTYAANTTGTSTIAVSCSANTYTINLDKDLTPTSAGTPSITATYNSNSNLTSAITPPTKTGWTFAGYFTAKNGGGTQIIDASGNVIASAGGGSTYTDASKNWKYAGDITLYAKWTCTVTWSVNNLTNVYSAQTLTYNGSSTKVASIPGPPSPASYCGDKFVGWTTEANVSQDDDDGLGLFTTVAGSPELKTVGNTTFYAVFADYDE